MKLQDLDDHAPIEPDDGLLASVHARSTSFRRRRRTQRLSSVMSGVVVLALATGIAWTRLDPSGSRKLQVPAASSTTTTPSALTQNEITGKWRPTSITGYHVGPLNTAYLDFDGHGAWTGNDGCNYLGGSYHLDENGVRFGRITSTLMACRGEYPDFGAIESAPRSEIRDGQLTFVAADGSEIARFVRPTVTARIDLPSTTMTAGSTMSGHVVIENNTGKEIHVGGCGGLFQVILGNAEIHPDPAWLKCETLFTIPGGETSYAVTVVASYGSCTATAGTGLPVCLPDGGGTPPLPPGDYQAQFFQSSPIAATPPPIDVQVEPQP